MMSEKQRRRRTTTGVVARDPKDKTIPVKTVRLVRHPRYRKYVRRATTYHVHDPKEEARAGDIVEIMQCRPLSKTKSWRLVRVLSRKAENGSEEAS